MYKLVKDKKSTMTISEVIENFNDLAVCVKLDKTEEFFQLQQTNGRNKYEWVGIGHNRFLGGSSTLSGMLNGEASYSDSEILIFESTEELVQELSDYYL